MAAPPSDLTTIDHVTSTGLRLRGSPFLTWGSSHDPSKYDSVAFRHPNEARVACLLDLLNIDWRYECWSTQVGGRKYVPDFLLDNGFVLEVKSGWRYDRLTGRDRKIHRLAGTGVPSLLLHGELPGSPADAGFDLMAGPGLAVAHLIAPCGPCGRLRLAPTIRPQCPRCDASLDVTLWDSAVSEAGGLTFSVMGRENRRAPVVAVQR